MMQTRCGFIHKPFVLKSLGKSKQFEILRYFIPVKHNKTGHLDVFFIELFSINPSLYTRQLQFASISETKNKSEKPSFILVRAGLIAHGEKYKHIFFTSKDIRYDKKNKRIQIGSSFFASDAISGSIEQESQSIEWKIAFLFKEFQHYFLSHRFYFSQNDRLKTKLNNSCFFTHFSGSLRFGADYFEVLENKQLLYSDHSWGNFFVKPAFWFASQSFISLISGKKIQNSHFTCASFYQPKNKKYKTYFVLDCNNQRFRFLPKQMQVSIHKKEAYTQWVLSAENKAYLMDLDIYAKASDMVKIGYSFESIQRLDTNHLFSLGAKGYGELRLYKKKKKNLEIIEHVRIENCLCEQALNVPPNI
ncbi:MAG: hypothetical protein QM387_05590 [Spirochaetota bacterium]|nr:hypothetical protein [Spirochaetota bacterium]